MRADSYSPSAPRFRVAAQPFALRLPNLALPAVGLALLAILIAAQAIHGFTDPDYWWHYKTGEYIATHYALPRVDIFSFPSAGQPWMTHEWLAETLIYALVRIGGYGLALVLFTLSPLVAT